MSMSNAHWTLAVSKISFQSMNIVSNLPVRFVAHGILCPSMSTADDARKLVSFAKFPVSTKAVPGINEQQRQPHVTTPSANAVLSGTRGVGSPFAPAAFRQTLAEYIRTANRNTLVAVQIETLEGLENCEEIARVDGIGMPPSPLPVTFGS